MRYLGMTILVVLTFNAATSVVSDVAIIIVSDWIWRRNVAQESKNENSVSSM